MLGSESVNEQNKLRFSFLVDYSARASLHTDPI